MPLGFEVLEPANATKSKTPSPKPKAFWEFVSAFGSFTHYSVVHAVLANCRDIIVGFATLVETMSEIEVRNINNEGASFSSAHAQIHQSSFIAIEQCSTPSKAVEGDRRNRSLSTLRTIMKNRERSQKKGFRFETERKANKDNQTTLFPAIPKTVTFDEESPIQSTNNHESKEPVFEQVDAEHSMSSASSAWAMVGDGKLEDKSTVSTPSPAGAPPEKESSPTQDHYTKDLFSPIARRSQVSPINSPRLTAQNPSEEPSFNYSFTRSCGPRFHNNFSPQTSLDDSALYTRRHEEAWYRNQTLVKEIRFAEQTCMELSCANRQLEERNCDLKAEVSSLKCALEQANRTVQECKINEHSAVAKADSLTSQLETLQMQLDLQVAVAKKQMLKLAEASRMQSKKTFEELMVKANDLDQKITLVSDAIEYPFEKGWSRHSLESDSSFSSRPIASSVDISSDGERSRLPSAVGNVPGQTLTTNDDIVSQFSEEYSESASQISSLVSSYNDNGAFPTMSAGEGSFTAHMNFLVSPNAVAESTTPPTTEAATQTSSHENAEEELRNQFTQLCSEKNELENELATTKSNLISAQETLGIAQKKLQASADIASKNNSLQGEVQRLNASVKDLEARLDTECKERKRVQIQLSNLQTRTITCGKKQNLFKSSLKRLRGKPKKAIKVSSSVSPYKIASPYQSSPYREVKSLRVRVDKAETERNDLETKARELEKISKSKDDKLRQASIDNETLLEEVRFPSWMLKIVH